MTTLVPVAPSGAAGGLDVSRLTVRFGGVVAAERVSFSVPAGRVVGLIGPNGAGKTTVVDAITGLVEMSEGRIALAGRRVDGLPAHRRARLGLRRTFQALALFEDLTVAENLAVATDAVGAQQAGSDRLDRLGLAAVADSLPGSLSHGHRSLVSLARALVAGPTVALLDEPAAGLDGIERAALGRRLRALADEGLGILLVEHDLDLVFDICDEVVVLDTGRVIANGPPAEVRNDPRVLAAYLGRPTDPPEGPEARPTVADSRPAADDEAARGRRPVLEVVGLTAGYGAVPAVRDVDLVVGEGEIVALLGVNGAGRTTTLASVAGVIGRMAGQVRLAGVVTPARPHQIARRGLAFVPAGRTLFSQLTVAENLRLAVGPGEPITPPPGFEMIEELLHRRAGLLSGGEARVVALARALLRRPRVLLVDELSLGLGPKVVATLLEGVRALARSGTAVLLVEQHPHLAVGLADRAYVLTRGHISGGGPAGDVNVAGLLDP